MANEKKAFILRVSPDLLKALEKWAGDEFRSVNGQVEYLLHKALAESGRLRKKQDGRSGKKDGDH
ncbi:MAG TPA: Arc family DNA-binding protein [Bacteroidia bacterium]|nr:Arc family DNA-binding protein [Bacteroidia bacterium]